MNITENTYSQKEYKRSRNAYTLQCAFEYFVTILVSDAFLAKLLTAIGISDSLIGIISSFVTLAFLFQLFTVICVSKIKNIKKTAIFFSTLSQVLFACLYLVPFMYGNVKYKTVLVALCILLAYFSNYFVTSVIYKWGNSFVNPTERGVFSAKKEIISLISGMIFTFIVGFVIDSFEAMGNLNGGFLFSAISVFVLSVCNFISLSAIKEQKNEAYEDSVTIKETVKYILKNKNFINVIIMSALWDISRYMTIGFMGTFKTKDLMFSLTAIQIINIVANLLRAVFSKPIGKFSDKFSYSKGMKLGFLIALLGYVFNVFSTPSTRWCVVVYTILYNVSLAGTNQNNFNIAYSYVEEKYLSQAMAIKNSISGVCGFCASVTASRILSYIQNNGNTFLGFNIYGQQLLSFASLSVLLLTIAFSAKKIKD